MKNTEIPIWRLVELCAQELTTNGLSPFSRGDLIRCVQLKRPGCEENSINPIIQGVTENLRGGAPGAIGKEILHSVSRGLFVLRGRGQSAANIPNVIPQRKRWYRRGEAPRAARTKTKGISSAGMALRIGKYEFRHICVIQVDREPGGTIVEHVPHARYKNAKALPLSQYGHGPFCRFRIATDLRGPGVYALLVNGQTKYIGECRDLSSRYNAGYGCISPRNCFMGGQDTNCRINHLVLQQIRADLEVSLWFYLTEDHKAIERTLRISVSPPWNKV